jgi:type IV secretion system protein VirB9
LARVSKGSTAFPKRFDIFCPFLSKTKPFETTFLYPDTDSNDISQFSRDKGPDLSEPDKYNFNYTISGSSLIAPIRVFDDGEFTYFQFPYKNAEIPAFFLVDSEGREALINYRMNDDYVVLERVASQLTLRHGSDVTCIFNESLPLELLDSKKAKRKDKKAEKKFLGIF